MPQLSTLTVNDRATTPVGHTFTPRSLNEGVARLVKAGTSPIGERSLTLSLRQSGNKYKSRMVLAYPVVVDETINGVVVPKVARTAYAEVSFTFDSTSTTQERNDTVGMLVNALAASQPLTHGVIVNLEGVF